MGEWTKACCIVALAGLSACAEARREPPTPPAKQPSVLDRAIAPAVNQFGGRIGPQGGIEFPGQPPR